MGAMKRLVDERADANRCVLKGCELMDPVPFFSGQACKACHDEWAKDFDAWQAEQYAKRVAAAEMKVF